MERFYRRLLTKTNYCISRETFRRYYFPYLTNLRNERAMKLNYCSKLTPISERESTQETSCLISQQRFFFNDTSTNSIVDIVMVECSVRCVGNTMRGERFSTSARKNGLDRS